MAGAKKKKECRIPIANKQTLCFPSIDKDSKGVEYVRVEGEHGEEMVYWDHHEWMENPKGVMGAILGAIMQGADWTKEFKVGDTPQVNDPVILTVEGNTYLAGKITEKRGKEIEILLHGQDEEEAFSEDTDNLIKGTSSDFYINTFLHLQGWYSVWVLPLKIDERLKSTAIQAMKKVISK